MLLSNILKNRLDDLVDSPNKDDIINRRQSRNATRPQLLAIERNRVANYFELEEQIKDV